MGRPIFGFAIKTALFVGCASLLMVLVVGGPINPDQLELLRQIRRETPELQPLWTDSVLSRACDLPHPAFGIKECTEDGWVTVIHFSTWKDDRFTLAPSMAKMTRLISLTVDIINGTLPSSWGDLFRLEQLRLGGLIDEKRDIPLSWANMKSLKNLTLAGGAVKAYSYESLFGDKFDSATKTNVKVQEKATTRSESFFDAPPVPFPAAVAAMPSLQNVWLDSVSYSGSLPDSLSRAVRVAVMYAPLTGAIPEPWATSTSLRAVYLLALRLTGSIPSDWSRASELRILRLLSIPFTGSLPSRLPSKIRVFISSMCELQGTLPPALLHESPELEFFDVNFNKIGGTIPSPLPNNPKLYLDLNTNAFTGTVPATIYGISTINVNNNYGLTGRLPRLSDLPSGFNCTLTSFEIWSVPHMEGEMPSDLLPCSKLRNFRIAASKFVGTIPSLYAHLPALENLDVGGNQLVGTLPNGPWPSLRVLKAYQNANISGTIPSAILLRPNLDILSISLNSIDICGNLVLNQRMPSIYSICQVTPQNPPISTCKCEKLWPRNCDFRRCS